MRTPKFYLPFRVGPVPCVCVWPLTREELLGSGVTMGHVSVAKQTHSDVILDLDELSWREVDAYSSWDGAIWSDPDRSVAVRTADCMPIALYAEKDKVCGLLHLSWRNAALGMWEKFLKQFTQKLRYPNQAIDGGVGPHLCGSHLRLSSKVYLEACRTNRDFMKQFFSFQPPCHESFRWEAWIKDTARYVGISNVTFLPYCTLALPIFPSFRRTGKAAPSIVTILGPQAVSFQKEGYWEMIKWESSMVEQNRCFWGEKREI